MSEQNEARMNEQDTIAKAIRRNLVPKKAFDLLRRGVHCFATRGAEATWREISFRLDLARGRDGWHHRADIPLRRELKAQRAESTEGKPLISVVVPLYNTPPAFLRQMAESVLGQSYKKLELVLVDASDEAHGDVGAYCRSLADERVTYIRAEKNEGISGNTNLGLAAAKGEYIALLDHDDTISLNALYEVAKAICEQGADLLYSDEIVLDGQLKELREYHYKPDHSPDTLRGCNYITHFLVFSRELLEKAGGGEDSRYDGAQDFDLILRLSEKAQKIVHNPKVLNFWRSHALSTASDISAKPYALAAGANAINAHLERVGIPGRAEPIPGGPGSYRVRYALTGSPLISVMIPNKDHVEDLSRCLESLYAKAGYENFEVLVLENNSTDPATFAYYEEAKAKYRDLRVLTYEGDNDTQDTSPTFKVLEEGAATLSKEETGRLAAHQMKFIRNLEMALVRVENKTYGICKTTGKLIPKERLMRVPHATECIEAKERRK